MRVRAPPSAGKQSATGLTDAEGCGEDSRTEARDLDGFRCRECVSHASARTLQENALRA